MVVDPPHAVTPASLARVPMLDRVRLALEHVRAYEGDAFGKVRLDVHGLRRLLTDLVPHLEAQQASRIGGVMRAPVRR